jgi:hypothetical protein
VAVIDADALDASDVPTALVAVTVNVYEVEDCNPVTVSGDDAPVAVNPPGEEVAVNDVAVGPEPAVNETVAAPLLYARLVPTSEADTPVGIPGLPFPTPAISPPKTPDITSSRSLR